MRDWVKGAAAIAVSVWAVAGAPQAVAEETVQDDPYLWLEEVEGERALEWVRARNAETLGALEADPRYEDLHANAVSILTAQDRIPYGSYRGGYVYNFWQDETHVRGLWRRATLESYRTDAPEWDVILDIDALAEAEDENWVFEGANCLAPDYQRCLVTLSRGGTDASVVREFDVDARDFVEDGFILPESKGGADWIDENTLFVARDWGEGSLTTSGYPRVVKIWERGKALEEAPTVFEGEEADVAVSAFSLRRPEGTVHMVRRAPSFFEGTNYILRDDRTLTELPLPLDISLMGYMAGQMLVMPQTDWATDVDGESVTYATGTLYSFDLASLLETGVLPRLTQVLAPEARASIQSVSDSRSYMVVTLLENVTAEMKRFSFDAESGTWTSTDIPLPANGSAYVASANAFHDTAFVGYESFLVPDSLYELGLADLSLSDLKQLPARFEADGYVTHQYQAESADGTQIPYFVVHKEGVTLDGSNPTLQYGYGGFRIALTPSYSGTVGKLWLEQGGVYVVANIRGGDEFGPAWHEAALKTNRQRAFDDFIAVSEDLIERGITSPERLGIYGGSNGGLLVGAAVTQRPDLYGAVVCAVPLLDMLRYHLLPPGASWIGEYGNPDIPEERAAIAAYSPYQNLSADAEYPRVFFQTSTKDDRVHPGHARKMAARMLEQGHAIRYYENIEGGHSAAANLLQSAQRLALMYTYLSQELKGEAPEAE